MLRHSGMPATITNVVRCLYHNNKREIKLKGCRYDGFEMTRGVRQGCLSPLLFVLAIDILIRRLERLVGAKLDSTDPSAMTKAYADDTAMVVEDLPTLTPVILRTSDEFESFSGLQLNMNKTVVIPLWDHTSESLKETYGTPEMSRWWQAKISTSGTYLGFEVGPGRGDSM